MQACKNLGSFTKKSKTKFFHSASFRAFLVESS